MDDEPRPALDDLRQVIGQLRDQLGEVQETLRWDRNPGDTSQALIAMAPTIGELGAALGRLYP
jgi:molybdopterin converting factor small subunit